MSPFDELAAQRALKAEMSGRTSAKDVLHLALSELEKQGIRSVLVLAVREDGPHVTYAGGPDLGTYQQSWLLLQSECLRVIQGMLE